MTSKILRADSAEITGIKSVTFTEKVNADIDLRPGCVSSAYIDVEVFGSQSAAPGADEALTYYQVDSEGNETLIGIFYAEPSVPSRNTYKFTAYDAVSKLDKSYSERLNAIQDNFPMSVYDLVSDACSVAGVTLGSSSWPLSTQSVEAFYADGLTCRNILQYAAEIAGRFVRCNTSGEVIFDWYTTASTGITPGTTAGNVPFKQGGLTYDNFTVMSVDAVAIKPAGTEGAAYIYPTSYGTVSATDPNGDGNVILQNLVVSDDGNGNLYLSVGAEDNNGNVEITQSASASNTLILSGNLLLTNATEATYTAAAQNVYQVMSSLPAYRHAVVQLFSFLNPFRAGQFVSITDAQGVSFTAPIFEMRVQASGAEIKSSGKQSYEDTDQTTVAKTLANLANNIVQIDKLKVGYAEIDELIANWIRTGKITVEDENGNIIFNADAGENEVEIGQFEVTDEGFISANASSGWTIPYNVIITKAGNAAFRSRMVGQEFVAMNGTSTPYYARITNGGIRYYSGGSVNYNPATGLIAIIGGTQERSISDSEVYIPDETSTLGGKDVGGTEIWKNLVVGDGEFGDRDDPGNMGHLVFTGRLYQMQSRQTVYSPFVFRDVLADIDSCVKKSGDTMTGNLVINGSTDVGAALADSGWQNVTYETGFQDFAATNLLRYRKVGKVVQITGAATPTAEIAAGAAAQAIFQLPTGYRPVQYVYTRCQGSDLNTWLCSIGPDGYVSISRYGTTSSIAIPSGAWLPMSITFLV